MSEKSTPVGEPTTDESDQNEAVGAKEQAGTEEAGASAPAKGGSRRRQLEREGEVAADFLETLLDIADLDGDIDLDIDGDRAAVAVVDSDEGRVPRRLVGQDGKVLEALQELTRLAVQSATGDRSRLMLDVAGHRAARRAELVEVARAAIASVKESGESYDLEPMTAFERKVVHDEVLAGGLVSDSSGTEPRRFVVVHPAEGEEAKGMSEPGDDTSGTDADEESPGSA
ncbi:R3H domain-containing nucleic acid-binding protein [Janibacter sp. DB-40]|uniref:Jag family protein n=1 Tax=Janibacter sp. DB-40 TaxID=3028808 RepID=UPI0024075EC0|nr:R3H domain-containing nucleic acid-binding protein [Janibacter sp. DB-40]